MQKFNILPGRATIPDHSILQCTVNMSLFESNTDTSGTPDNAGGQSELTSNNMHTPFRKYDAKSVNDNMFESNMCLQQLNDLITRIENCENNQCEIDALYEDFIHTVHIEMDAKMDYKDIRPGARKRKKHFAKPWWCNKLKDLWTKTCQTELSFLNCKGPTNRKKALRTQYKRARDDFDKTLRQRERQYFASKREYITNVQTRNPKEFWNEINKLGPEKNKQSASYVKMENGNISHNNTDILNKWKKDFSQLLGEANGNYDEDFLNDIRIITANWERDYSDHEAYLDLHGNRPEVQSITDLIAEITLHEVNKMINDAKH